MAKDMKEKPSLKLAYMRCLSGLEMPDRIALLKKVHVMFELVKLYKPNFLLSVILELWITPFLTFLTVSNCVPLPLY